MKMNDWILTASVGIYSYLFYQQSLGINFLLFTISIIVLLLLRNKEIIKNRNWVFSAIGCLLSAGCVFYYGNGLSLTANIISLCILSAYSINPKTSIIVSLFFSAYSISASYVFLILDTIDRSQNKIVKAEGKKEGMRILPFLIPFIVVLVFFFMYKASNPLFDNFTKKINLDFISLSWILFTFAGFFIMYGLFNHKRIKMIADGDEAAANTISQDSLYNHSSFLKLSLDNEKLSGIILLLMLNLLLLTVNILDADFLWLDGTLPKELTYSAFVHQGTGVLILSITIAILIILYYFRGALNFYKGNKILKYLSYLWIAQNAFMVISTASRNKLYIDEYSLTYKRIGVYIWLILAMIGLMTTFFKIAKTKSNWFLFRSNGWLFYAVLISACFVNWDVLVTGFNISKAELKQKPLDKLYLTSLSEKNIPQLLALNDSIKNKTDFDNLDLSSVFSRYDYSPIDYKPALHKKIYDFLGEMQDQEWQSTCIEKDRVYAEILNKQPDIKVFELQNNYLQTLKPISILTNIQSLYFTGNQLKDLTELKQFPVLENLYLESNYLDSIDFFPIMDHLKFLSLSNNNIKKLNALKNIPYLTYLNISNNKQVDFKTLPGLKKLSSLVASDLFINDFLPLLQLPELKELILSNSIVNNKLVLPVLHKLERLDLHNNQIFVTDTTLFEKLSDFNSLIYLNLSDNQLNNLYALTSYYDIKKSLKERKEFAPLIPSLRSLDVSRNNVNSIRPLLVYKDLEELYLNGNMLTESVSLEQFTKLKILSVEGCGLQNIKFLKKLKALEVLSIGTNDFSDYSPLYEMENLKQLNIGTVTKRQLDHLKKALPKTAINATVNN